MVSSIVSELSKPPMGTSKIGKKRTIDLPLSGNLIALLKLIMTGRESLVLILEFLNLLTIKEILLKTILKTKPICANSSEPESPEENSPKLLPMLLESLLKF